MPYSKRAPVFLFVSSILIIAFLSSCGFVGTPTPTLPPPTATPVPLITPTPPAGWSIHRTAAFQIAMPGTWQEFPLDDATLKGAIDAASNDNPHLADTLRAILSTGQNKNLLFYGADKSGQKVVSNVSIARTPLQNTGPVATPIREYADALPQILKGAKLISINAPLEVNGQNAGEVVYDLPLVNAAGEVVNVRGIQYLFPATDAFVVTVTGDAGDADRFMPLARQIARSFVILSK